MPSANSDFYFFPSDLDAFYFFVCVCMCLIAMARIVNIMINRSGESGRACPVPDLKGKAFSFSPLSMILAVHVCECVLVTQSSPTLFHLWTVASQAPPSMGFPRQEYWSG